MRQPLYRPALLFLAFALTATAAHAPSARAQDQPDPEALRSSLTEMLSLLSFGAVSVPDHAARVTQSGAEFRIQLPLNGFAAPIGASAEAVARPAPNGLWDITSMIFPSAGALGTSIDQVVSYTIGQQTVHGRLDPTLTMPSTFVADLGAIAVLSASVGQDTDQTIGRMTLDGTLSTTPDGRLDLLTRNSATDWHIVARDPVGMKSDSLVRRLDGQFSLHGLDRARGVRLLDAVRSLMRTAQTPDRPPNLTPAERQELRDMLDATTGLLTRIEADGTLDGMTFDLGGGNTATLGRMRLQMKGSAEDHLLNAGLDIAMDEFSSVTQPADSAWLLPHHLTARSILAGLPLGPLMALLQAALAPDADQAVLQGQTSALLDIPGARAAIESVAFDAGPLQVRGSARFLPRANGEVGTDIHISATGTDALIAQAQGKPGMQSVLPMVLLAKGMGRVQGDSIVWDISLGGGPMTVNGLPFGQPAAPRR